MSEKKVVQEHSIVMEDGEYRERRDIEHGEDGIVVIWHTRKMDKKDDLDDDMIHSFEYTVIGRRENGKIMSTSISTEMSSEDLKIFQECWKEVWEFYYIHRSQSFLPPPEDQFVQKGLATAEPGIFENYKYLVQDVEVTTQKRSGANQDNWF